MTWKLSDNYHLTAELGWKEALRHLLLVLSLGQAVLPGHVQQGLDYFRSYFILSRILLCISREGEMKVHIVVWKRESLFILMCDCVRAQWCSSLTATLRTVACSSTTTSASTLERNLMAHLLLMRWTNMGAGKIMSMSVFMRFFRILWPYELNSLCRCVTPVVTAPATSTWPTWTRSQRCRNFRRRQNNPICLIV